MTHEELAKKLTNIIFQFPILRKDQIEEIILQELKKIPVQEPQPD